MRSERVTCFSATASKGTTIVARDLQHVTVSGTELAYLEAGDPEGPLALCLHGFPDTAWGWERLVDDLADRGHHAVAPFLAGYAPSAVPPGGVSFLGGFVRDANALHEALGGGSDAVLVGHDWGALTAYGAASSAPDRWRRVVTAALPPTSVMAVALTDYVQMKLFWYQRVFMEPSAEDIVAADDLAFIERLWEDWSPGYDGTAAVARVKDALRDRAHLTAALGSYRGMFDFSLVPPELLDDTMAALSPHPQPTLYLHGAQDGCCDVRWGRAAEGVLPEGSEVHIIEAAGHFLQYEQPDVVNRLIVDFVTR
jgi:pimeloyl-ACP methyl ester carboxylesterase